jgi:hypothetical protein
MTLQRHQQLILWGFLLAYCGVMGSLAALPFGEYGRVAIKFILLPGGIIGGCLIAMAMVSHVRSE